MSRLDWLTGFDDPDRSCGLYRRRNGAERADCETVPDFSSNETAWKGPNGVNFIPVLGSPPPITNDPEHPHISNGEAIRRGVQPTYRIADLTHPNLKQGAKEVMKKDNEEVLKGKIAYTPGSYCRPCGRNRVSLSTADPTSSFSRPRKC